MTIHRFNPLKAKKENSFFIQSHGLHAGKPLRNPIPNSWQIDTEVNNAFELCFMVYNSRFLKNYLRGSVIPFLSIREYKKVIEPIFKSEIQNEIIIQKKLKALELIDSMLQAEIKKQKYFNEMKITLANEILKSFL